MKSIETRAVKSSMKYSKGLQDLGGGCYAWMQPDGSWGWSNAGLVVGAGSSLVVDTLFDLVAAREMLNGVSSLTTTSPLSTVVNTHSDPDHYFGNQIFATPGVEIISSTAAAEMISQEAVQELIAIKQAGGRVGDFARTIFEPFVFDDITVTPPTRTFHGKLSVDVGGREVVLIEVGPAHTVGDVLVHVPDSRLMYTGDILFVGATPVVWSGPPERWIETLDRLLDMPLTRFVPGHGAVTNKTGVSEVRDYLQFVNTEATRRFEHGMSVDAAITSIKLGRFAEMSEHSRLAQNVAAVFYALDPDMPRRPRMQTFDKMAELEGFSHSTAVHKSS
ncbi:MBL fold metallo-hydrolase [Nocardia sp. NPDC004168]|uniref:MBL fold metallo-hydrolase n=1 Tax=Nocardia sp. NPDC004168 TaxID=3154452 RepID=UPI0033B899C0